MCAPCLQFPPNGRLEAEESFHVSTLSVINLPHRQEDPEIARVRVALARSETVVVIHSALSTSAVGVRAAYLPGSAATTFPSISAPMPT